MKKFIPEILLLLCFAFFFWTGSRAIDVGYHWDEKNWQIKPAQEMLMSGTFLPHIYLYPSASLWIVMASTIPDFIHFKLNQETSVKTLVTEKMNTPEFLFRLRRIFLFIGALSIIGVYLCALQLTQNRWASLLSAFLFSSSWEVQYHARWVATDTLLMTFGIYCFYFALRGIKEEKFCAWSAFFAGLGTGSKYPGALLLFFPCFSVWVGSHTKLKSLAKVFAIAAGTYLITTPGTWLEPIKFLEWVNHIRVHYASALHSGYNVAPGAEYSLKIILYFAEAFFSSVTLLSIIVFLSVGGGFYCLFKKNKSLFAMVAGFGFLSVVFFSKQTVFIVRNFLFLGPFFAVIFSVFFVSLNKKLKKIALGVALLIASVNSYSLWKASNTIVHKEIIWEEKEFTEFLFREKEVLLSPALSNFSSNPQPANPRWYAFRVYELEDFGNIPANQPGIFSYIFGRREVNLVYYPSWSGGDHIVVLNPTQFEKLKKKVKVETLFSQL